MMRPFRSCFLSLVLVLALSVNAFAGWGAPGLVVSYAIAAAENYATTVGAGVQAANMPAVQANTIVSAVSSAALAAYVYATGNNAAVDATCSYILTNMAYEWVSLSPTGAPQITQQSDLSSGAQISIAAVAAAIAADPTGKNDYPNLWGAFFTQGALGITLTTQVGQVVIDAHQGIHAVIQASSGYYCTSFSHVASGEWDSGAPVGPSGTESVNVCGAASSCGCGQCVTCNGVTLSYPTAVPPVTPLSPASTLQDLQGPTPVAGVANPVNGVYSGDIDKFIKENPQIISYESPPAAAVPITPAQLAAANANPVTQANIAASTAAGSAVTAAQNAATAATNAATAACAGASNGTPGCLAAQAAAATAASAAASAVSNAATINATSTAAANPAAAATATNPAATDTSSWAAPAANPAYTNSALPLAASIDFGARVTTFVNVIKSSALFGLPGAFVAGIPSGGNPVYSFNCGRYGVQSYDFSKYTTIYTMISSIFLIVCTWVGVKIITKGGGG